MVLDRHVLCMLDTQDTLCLSTICFLYTRATLSAAFIIKKHHLSRQPSSGFSKTLTHHCHNISSFISQQRVDGKLLDARVWNAVLMALLLFIGTVQRFEVGGGCVWVGEKGKPRSGRSNNLGFDIHVAPWLILWENGLATHIHDLVNDEWHYTHTCSWQNIVEWPGLFIFVCAVVPS